MRPEPGGWVTMQGVADAAGVSAMTVSRALRWPERVRAPTRARIDAAIAALGHVPDQAAGSLSSRRSRQVAMLLSTLSGSIFARTVDGLAGALRGDGRHLLLGTTDYSTQSEEALLRATLSRRPDGIVLTSGEHTAASRALLHGSGIPVVEVWELPDEPIDMALGFSNLEAGRCMTRFLFTLGCQPIGHLGGLGPSDRRGRLRHAGYLRAVEELGLGAPRCPPELADGPPVEQGAAGITALLAAWPDTECRALRQRRGRAGGAVRGAPAAARGPGPAGDRRAGRLRLRRRRRQRPRPDHAADPRARDRP